MDTRTQLDDAIAPFNLLEHPFYQAWNDGTLPTVAIATYAAEYGTFIAGIDAGWTTVGNPEHAAEERHHAELWNAFAESLGTSVTEAAVPEVRALNDTAARLFAKPATAWGALYAFEAQQPATAATKLAGLDTHYEVDEAGRVYFEVHANDLHEADMIAAELDGEADVTATVAACAEMSKALWDALSGVYAPYEAA